MQHYGSFALRPPWLADSALNYTGATDSVNRLHYFQYGSKET